MNKRNLGAIGEQIVKLDYEQKGYTLIKQNYTIQGGEIDLIFEKDDSLLFVEVRVLNFANDLVDFVGKNKLNFVKKTINYFIHTYNFYDKEVTIDIVVVKGDRIIQKYENIYFDN